ncbi:MAG: PAS domain-containing protein [Gammaproteobacteria bacterium]
MTAKTRKQGAPPGPPEEMETLRRWALKLLNEDPGQLAEMKPQDLNALLHELQVHQVELEMQNQELREARNELELTQAEYTSLYDYAPVGYLSLDPDGRIRRLNLMATDLLGKPRQSLVGTFLSRYIADADRAIFQQKIQQAMDGNERHTCELRLQRPDAVKHIHFECQTVTREENSLDALRITMTDISQRVAAADQLRISRRQLEEALEASQCGLWDWPDVERDEAWWSPEFYRLLRYENGALRPGYSSFKNLLHSKDRERVLKALEGHIHQGMPFDTEFRMRTRAGDYRWFRGHGQIIRDSLGALHMAGLLLDVSTRHESDEALHRARDKAEHADRYKSRYLAAASHDLRQPLQSLSLYLSSLQQLPGTAESAQLITKMHQSIQSMGQLLRTLLNVSRLDAGIIEPEPVAFPITELFSDIMVINGPSAEARGLALRIHSSDCLVFSDRVLLHEIVQNFVTNALHNTDRGGVLIGCRRRGDKAWIQVWDTGIGIPPDRLSELLSPSEPAREQQDVRDGNTVRPGLGMAIIRQIAGLLGYRLYAESVPDRGSMFAVEVPLAQAADRPPAVSGEWVSTGDGHLTLLVVDNDPAILDACRGAATAAGHRPACAKTAAEALAQVQEGLRPDAIICDLRLRRIPGTEVIRRLRNALGENTPAILLTGDTSSLQGDVEDLTRCRVLYKPVAFDVLTRTIKELLAKG